jgi:hypothetical protein
MAGLLSVSVGRGAPPYLTEPEPTEVLLCCARPRADVVLDP